MREALIALEGQRVRVRGVFRRFGRKPIRDGRAYTITVLLEHVLLPDGSPFADHLWFNLTRGFAALDLERGAVVELTGRVARYRKVPRAWEGKAERPASEDLKLVRPTALRVAGREVPPVSDDPRARLLARLRAGEAAVGLATSAVLALYQAEQPAGHYGEVLIARGQLAIVHGALHDLRTLIGQVPV